MSSLSNIIYIKYHFNTAQVSLTKQVDKIREIPSIVKLKQQQVDLFGFPDAQFD